MTTLFSRLRRRRTSSTETTASNTSTGTLPVPVSPTPTQPLAEEPTQHSPPPYSASTTDRSTTDTPSTRSTQENGPSESVPARTVVTYDITQGLLDPHLNFTAAQMEQQWKQKDIIFARAVVQFIAERFDGNLKGWAGYKYTYICESFGDTDDGAKCLELFGLKQYEENPPRKESAWDEILGYNAWSYRHRFRQVNFLVKRDFEKRGFEVRKCEVYAGVDGIYVEWTLEIRRSKSSK